MWDAEESARRGFACPREWKQRLTSREYEWLKAVSRKWYTGDARRDLGLAKHAVFVGSCFAEVNPNFDLRRLMPNEPPEGDETEQLLRTLEQWPGAASEP